MVILIRVDDRLLHGQIICAWVPFTGADALIVASDEAASDSLVSDIISACGCKGLDVHVKSVADTLKYIGSNPSAPEKILLIVGELNDAMRLYEDGMKFASINLGNIHHEDNGRKITPSIIINEEDERVLERFEELGVSIDIRDVPKGEAIAYVSRKKKPC